MDIVQEYLKETKVTSIELFEEAYKQASKKDKTVDVSNFRWAHGIWMRSGIITKTIEHYVTKQLELPLDFQDVLGEVERMGNLR